MDNTTDLLEAAAEATKIGGQVLMRYLRDGVQMRSKTHPDAKTYDLVSDADIESENAIAAFLRETYPDHALLGEENLYADASSNDLWIIDPLDGTNNFAHGMLHFGVSIAYYRDGKPVVGAVFNPARDEMYTASLGGGAFLNQKRIHVSDATALSDSLIGCGFYYDRGDMMRQTLSAIEALFEQDIHGIRRFGTASLDLCQVATGQFGGFFEYQLSPWDFAAGALIVTEAGGKISTATGTSLPIESTSVLASNSHLHEPLLAITRKHHP